MEIFNVSYLYDSNNGHEIHPCIYPNLIIFATDLYEKIQVYATKKPELDGVEGCIFHFILRRSLHQMYSNSSTF